MGAAEDGLVHRDKQLLEAEDRPVEEAENHGGKADAGHHPADGHPLLFVEEQPQEGDQQPLAQIPEHDAEEKDVGKGHVRGGIQILVGGEAVHIHEHLKGLYKGQVLEAHRHRKAGLLVGVLQGDGHLVQVLEGIGEAPLLLPGDVPQHHKVVLYKGGLVPQLKGISQQAELGVELLGPLPLPGGHPGNLGLNLRQNALLPLEVLFDEGDGLLGGAVGVIRHPDTLKVEGLEEAVNLLHIRHGADVKAPGVAAVVIGGKEDKGTVAVAAQLLVAVQRQPAKAELNILAGEEAIEVYLQVGEMAQTRQSLFVGINQLLGASLFRQQLFQLGVQPVDVAGKLLVR